MRMHQLDEGKTMGVKISDLKINFEIIFYRIDFSRM